VEGRHVREERQAGRREPRPTDGKEEAMKKLMVAAVALAFASSAMAYEVYCWYPVPGSELPHESGFVTTSYVQYKVIVGVGENLQDFYVGYGVTPDTYFVSTTPYATGLTPVGWSGSQYWSTEDYDGFTDDGSVSPTHYQVAQSLHYSGTALTAGTYYFGYTIEPGSYALADVGWRYTGVMDNNDVINVPENWTQPLSGGLGPVHAPVPEPGTMALVGIGAGVMALRRRLQKK
jgi:hypothetical protein